MEKIKKYALEAIFDIGRHIIAKHAGKGSVEYKEIARLLGRNGVTSEGLSETLILMAGYRDRMVHFYQEVTELELYEILIKNLADIIQSTKEIGAFLEAYHKVTGH